MKARVGEVRAYPQGCRSAVCGRGECPAECPRRRELAAFKEWVEVAAAAPVDRVWSPNVYVATGAAQ